MFCSSIYPVIESYVQLSHRLPSARTTNCVIDTYVPIGICLFASAVALVASFKEVVQITTPFFLYGIIVAFTTGSVGESGGSITLLI